MELIKNLRQQIYREFKINPLDHFKCTNCGVGINKNEETFVIEPTEIEVWCTKCTQEKKHE